MNGAEAILRTLTRSGADTCFANAGTTEMHIVQALAAVPAMRAVPVLFEGVATGAADGYARMREQPGVTLLHLGLGLANGAANLHNARRARSALVNIVGDHATHHKQFDPPAESDIETLANNFSGFIRRMRSPELAGDDIADAIRAACATPSQIATVIVPSDVSWSDGARTASAKIERPSTSVHEELLEAAVAACRTGNAALVLGGSALRKPGLQAAGRIAAAGVRVLCETFPARVERGAGVPEFERLAYLGEMARAQLSGISHLVAVGAREPVTFFAYQGNSSRLLDDESAVTIIDEGEGDLCQALEAIADALDAAPAARPAGDRLGLPDGDLSAAAIAQAIGALLPEGAIVSDESITSGLALPMMTAAAPPHDWLTVTGGAIGQGLPVAIGAAVACPSRKVLALEADGSAMYTIQSLWTMVREALDVTTIVFNNRSYQILNLELARIGDEQPQSLFDLRRPDIDFVALASGMGMPACRVTTSEEFVTQLRRSLDGHGPSLIEAMIV